MTVTQSRRAAISLPRVVSLAIALSAIIAALVWIGRQPPN
jgi:hypothetical protein